jgi:hypothetical protein
MRVAAPMPPSPAFARLCGFWHARCINRAREGQMTPADLFGLLKDAFDEWSEDNCSRLAAALSYYTVFSSAPPRPAGSRP